MADVVDIETRTKLSDLEPPHRVTDAEKFERIRTSILTNGWKGPPLVAVERGDGYQLLTGSHRYAALRSIEREAGQPGAEFDLLVVDWIDGLDEACNPEDISAILAASGQFTAAALVAAEGEDS